jgi:hypothetical protein
MLVLHAQAWVHVKAVCMDFVAEKLALRGFFSEYFIIPLAVYIPTILYTHLSLTVSTPQAVRRTCHWRSTHLHLFLPPSHNNINIKMMHVYGMRTMCVIWCRICMFYIATELSKV